MTSLSTTKIHPNATYGQRATTTQCETICVNLIGHTYSQSISRPTTSGQLSAARLMQQSTCLYQQSKYANAAVSMYDNIHDTSARSCLANLLYGEHTTRTDLTLDWNSATVKSLMTAEMLWKSTKFTAKIRSSRATTPEHSVNCRIANQRSSSVVVVARGCYGVGTDIGVDVLFDLLNYDWVECRLAVPLLCQSVRCCRFPNPTEFSSMFFLASLKLILLTCLFKLV